MFNYPHFETIFNTVFTGGAYTFLIDKSKLSPLLIVNVSDWQNSIIADYVYQDFYERYFFDSLEDFFNKTKPSAVSINHLIWSQKLNYLIPKLLSLFVDIELKIYIHDFYSLCPTIHLLDYKQEYCNLPNITVCNNCLRELLYNNLFSQSKQEIESSYYVHNCHIEHWRKLWHPLFNYATTIILPSQSAANLWLRIYPQFKNKLRIIQHNLNYLSNIVKKISEPNLYFDVYVIGHIQEHKGRKIIHDILESIKNRTISIRIHILGEYVDDIFFNTSYLRIYGKYSHYEIINLLNNNKIDCFLMPSICPETFSYTAHEMMATGLPIISFNLGAQGEFISKYPYGVVVDTISAERMFDKLYEQYIQYLAKFYPILLMNISSDIRNEIIPIIIKTISLKLELIDISSVYETKTIQLKNENIKLANEIHLLKNELSNVFNSRSWKISQIIISIFKSFKKLLFLFR